MYNDGYRPYVLSVNQIRIESTDRSQVDLRIQHGQYTSIAGNKATAWGLIAAAEKAGKRLFLGSYPITPATDILHELAGRKDMNVMAVQAEDEIAAVCMAIGYLCSRFSKNTDTNLQSVCGCESGNTAKIPMSDEVANRIEP